VLCIINNFLIRLFDSSPRIERLKEVSTPSDQKVFQVKFFKINRKSLNAYLLREFFTFFDRFPRFLGRIPVLTSQMFLRVFKIILILGSVLVYDFWTPPPSYQFCIRPLFQQFSIISIYLGLG